MWTFWIPVTLANGFIIEEALDNTEIFRKGNLHSTPNLYQALPQSDWMDLVDFIVAV